MICIIDASNRQGFERELAEMHRLRALALADEASWHLATVEDRVVDAYDRTDSTYLLAKRDSRGGVVAAVRLLPTDRPHLMRDVFADGCLGPMPGGSTVWEVSRFCLHPEVRRRRDRAILVQHMTCAVMETALLFGVQAVIFLASGALLRYVLNCGWTATVLGPTLHLPTADVTAVQALITPEGLRSARLRFRLPGPVSRFPICPRIAA
jgi:acyl-homoserine lactone synthase